MASAFGISTNLCKFKCSHPSFSSNHVLVSHLSTICSSTAVAYQVIKLKNYLPKASAQGIPSELSGDEESKFVPLNADDSVYGPPALLLLGFEVEEAVKVRQLLQDLGGEFLQIIFCTEDMIAGSLWEAMNTSQADLAKVQIAKPLPRICFLSGLSGEDMMMFIDAFPESGLEEAVFAALVPNSANKPVQELIEEIIGDHEMLTGKQTS
ncbi:uncharacterized protein LOC126660841 [Mercurialis annua]|uniref:uncharacterized protein LOC126660841 n=1 Tax=Mercurialis annua TaxID=3986 RepID=UPI00215FE6BB|nr:uncharacterized protein LOC126660841 [Mercurialis annua]